MFSDGVVNLVEKGAITNSRKVVHTGKIVGGFAFGTKRLYDFMDNNPFIGMFLIQPNLSNLIGGTRLMQYMYCFLSFLCSSYV